MSIISKLSVSSFIITAALALQACSSMGMGSKPPETVSQLQASAKVPAAEGTVKVQEGDNGNYKVALDVKHMAPPDKVTGGASTYVVWLRPLPMAGADTQQPQTAQNVGALALNKDLEAKLNTVTPFRQFDLFVTAEPAPNTPTPTGDQLLTTTIRK